MFLEYANVRTFKNYYPFGMVQPGDEIEPMLVPATLPTKWGIHKMTGWMGALQMNPAELKVNLDYAPAIADWTLGKDLDSKALGTYELNFDIALDAASDNELKVTIKDATSDQIIKEEVYKTNGNFKLRYLATSDQTRILFQLKDPTPNIGSSLEVTGIALSKTDFGDYRYGFNGKENDQEWGKLIQDYGFRLYNPAIGKFLSVDPLTKGYPSWSPYPFAMNRPIDGIDLDGLEWWRMATIKKAKYKEATNAENVVHNTLGVAYNVGANVINFLPGVWNFTGNLLSGKYNNVTGMDLHNALQSVDRTIRKEVKAGVTLKGLGQAATNPQTYESVFTIAVFGKPKMPGVRAPRVRFPKIGNKRQKFRDGPGAQVSKPHRIPSHVYHYTTKAGYNAIRSGKDNFTFKVMGQSKNGKAVWFTTDSPQFLNSHKKGYKGRLGLTREKSEYYFLIDISESSNLKSLPGGRGKHIFFNKTDVVIPKAKVLDSGLTPKK